MLLTREEVMKTLKFVLCALVVALTAQVAFAESPYLVDDRTGKYLGRLSSDRYHPDSVSNPYGRANQKRQFAPGYAIECSR
jgi:hypothetical protein